MHEARERTPDEIGLASNRTLELGGIGRAWLVVSGRIAVFTVLHDGQRPIGVRRHRFDCLPGAYLFGQLTQGRPEPSVRIVAVALEPSLLQGVEMRSSPGPDEAAMAAWHARWSDALGHRFECGAPSNPVQLAQFQEELDRQLASAVAAERKGEHERLAAAEEATRQAADAAVGTLAAVLDPASAPPLGGAPLVAAMREVVAPLGVSLPAGCDADPAGEPAQRVQEIARRAGIGTREVSLREGWWRLDCGPILGFLRADQRPVALVRSGRSYRMLDPTSGNVTPVSAETAAQLDPRAHVFYAPLPDDANRAWGLVRFALRGRGRDLAAILATGIAATLLGMLVPQATALLVDDAIPDADTRLVIELAMALVAAACGAGLFRLAQGLAMLRLETGADAATQPAVWRRVLSAEVGFFRRFSTGDLESRISAVSQIRARAGGTTLRSALSSVMLCLNLLLLLYYSPRLTLVALAVAAVSAALTLSGGLAVLRADRRILELQGRFFGLMVQLLNGVSKLRAAAAEQRAFSRWATDFAGLARLELRRRRVQDALITTNVMLAAVSTIVLFVQASALVGTPGGLSAGEFLAFYVAYGIFVGALTSLSATAVDLLAIGALRERARPILEAPSERSWSSGAPGTLTGRVALEHVAFRYREDGPQVLSDVSFSVEPGEFVGLVGPSGGGKSTLFRLLLGFEKPAAGRIAYDGRDLGSLDLHAVRRQLGVVLQGGRIGAGSIFDAIAAGSRVSLAEAWEAVRAAGLAEEIEAMPMGLHTVVSEGGTNLSGGQKQRLLLARALVHRPRILMLDEATSALDNETQRAVSESLAALAVTRLVIAHRLSTIRRADRIFVLDGGRLVQQGSFDDLAAQDGPFARLIVRQRT